MKATRKYVGRPQSKSGLPPAIPGEPLSLIGTLRRTRTTLSVQDAATLLICTPKAVYGQIKAGNIPVIDLGFGMIRIDPRAWADLLEQLNPHLIPSTRKQMQRAA
jgi:hypothetical protein